MIYQGKFSDIFSFENLKEAYEDQTKVASNKAAFKAKFYCLDSYLNKLRYTVLQKDYQPTTPYIYGIFDCHRRKRRQIEAPHMDEAIIQRAIWRVVNPIIESNYTQDSYCGIINRGTEHCKENFFKYIHHIPLNSFYLKSDIYHYYDSIDHTILRILYQEHIADEQIIDLILKFTYPNSIHKYEKGLGIGHLMSQLSGNVYLNEFDKYMLNFPNYKYFRYADDFIILNFTSYNETFNFFKKISEFLQQKLKLSIKAPCISTLGSGGDFIGCKFNWSNRLHRFKRTLRADVLMFYKKALAKCDLPSIINYIALSRNTDSFNYVISLLPSNIRSYIPKSLLNKPKLSIV